MCGEQLGHAGNDLGSVFGQRQALGVSGEKSQPQTFFQLLDVPAERRLGNKQPLRRPVQIQFLGNHTEVIELPDIQQFFGGAVCIVHHVQIVGVVRHTQKVSRKKYDAKPAGGATSFASVAPPRQAEPTKEIIMQSERYINGLAMLNTIDGQGGVHVVESLQDIAPDFARYLIEFPFGDIYTRPGLDLKSREIAVLAALTALGNAAPQLKVHLAAALNVGCSREEIIEVIMQMAVYAGFPAALNGLFAAKEVFSERDAAAASGEHAVQAPAAAQNPADVVRAYFQAFGSGVVEDMLACLDDTVVWHIDGALSVPTVGLLRGKEQVRRWLSNFPSGFTPQQFDIDKLLVDGEDVIALGYFRHLAHLPADDESAKQSRFSCGQFALHFKVRNGKITRYQIYEDSLALARTFDAGYAWEHQAVNINGMRYAYTDTEQEGSTGQNPTIIFAHGLFVDHSIFAHQIRTLSKTHRCIALDMPGHGQSGYRPEGWSLDTIADDMALFIEELRLGPVIFVGQSQGGMVGMRLAAQRPDLVQRLVLVGTSADAEYPERLDTWRALRNILLEGTEAERAAAFAGIQQRVNAAEWLKSHSAEAEKERTIMLGHDRAGITLALDAATLQRRDITGLLQNIKAPTLILCGEEDTATPLELSRAMAQAIPNSRLEIFTQAGHHLPLEAAEKMAAALADFIR